MADIVGEEEIAALVAAVRRAPDRRGELVGLLREDAHDGRGANTTARIRAWVLAAFAEVGLPDEALPHVLEELQSGREPLLVAAAARALRGRPADPSTCGFLLVALRNMAGADDTVTFEALRPAWPPRSPTTALTEILTTLTEITAPGLAGGDPDLLDGLERFRRDDAGLLSAPVRELLDDLLGTVAVGHCCGADRPPVTGDGRTGGTGARPDHVVFEDQDGVRRTFTDVLVGRPTVVGLFYTRCTNPAKCSLTVTKLAAVARAVADRGLSGAVGVAAVTYDPGYDLPGRLRRYGHARGLPFGGSVRMLRAVAGHDALRRYLDLRVGYTGSLVNRHAIELFLLDGDAAVTHTWARLQWDPAEVLDRASALAAAGGGAGSGPRPVGPGGAASRHITIVS